MDLAPGGSRESRPCPFAWDPSVYLRQQLCGKSEATAWEMAPRRATPALVKTVLSLVHARTTIRTPPRPHPLAHTPSPTTEERTNPPIHPSPTHPAYPTQPPPHANGRTERFPLDFGCLQTLGRGSRQTYERLLRPRLLSSWVGTSGLEHTGRRRHALCRATESIHVSDYRGRRGGTHECHFGQTGR